MFDLTKSIEVLQRTPGVLRACLQGVSDCWTHTNYGEQKFSPFDVVGHLLEADQVNWMTRVRWILEHGTSAPFPAFDRYAMYASSAGKSLDELLDQFASLRANNLQALQDLRLTSEQLQQTGLHPDLGPVTLEQLLAAWVVHDLGHLHQVVKCMAFQYRNDVGPWREYLTILPRA